MSSFWKHARAALSALLILAGMHAPAMACDTCGCSFNPRRAGGRSTGAMAITPLATTLGKGHGSVGILFEAQRFNSIPADSAHALNEDEGHDVHGKDHEEFYDLSVGYGVLDNLDLYVIAPVVSKTTVEIADEDRLGEKDRATGVGDLRLVGKYRFWARGADGALLLGLKAPTGETSETKPSGKFEPEQQPGSGSWDLMTGLAVSRSFARHVTLAGSVQYTTRGEGAQDEKLGDVFNYNLGASYALKRLGQHPNLSLMLELRSEWALPDHSREQNKVWDSGGTTVLLSPGIAADLTPSLSAFWAMPIPIYQNLGGQHEELKYEILTGVSWHF